MKADIPQVNEGTNAVSKVLFKLPKATRGHVVAVLGEFFGTLSFIFVAFAGTQTANIS